MRRAALTIVLWLGLVPATVQALPAAREPRLHPRDVSEVPSFVRRIRPALVALRVRADEKGPSTANLGVRRFATAVIFDPRGYAVTVSYALLDAVSLEARTPEGNTVRAQVVGVDFDTGLGVVKLEGDGPWPAAVLGDSRDVAPGTPTGTVGLDEDGDLVHVTGAVRAVQPYAAYWEYMLDRAFLVAPSTRSWGGSAVVDERGHVVGIASLRLGQPPHVNLAIPLEKFVPVREELVALGRVASRPPRPWLGLYTVEGESGVVIDGFSPVGPARTAGFQKGDRIVSVDGVGVRQQAEFYTQLWRGRAGDVVSLGVVRAGVPHVISVRSVDRRDLFRTTSR